MAAATAGSSFAERWHPFLDFLVASGCRFSEATALTPADIDRVNGTVRITKGWRRTDTTGDTRYEIGPPKTRRSNRTIEARADDDQSYRLDQVGRSPRTVVL